VRFQIHPGEFVEILDELAPSKGTAYRQRVG
jgi:hypothetical protein